MQLTYLGQWVRNIEELLIIIENIFCHAQSKICAVNSVFSGPHSNLEENKKIRMEPILFIEEKERIKWRDPFP